MMLRRHTMNDMFFVIVLLIFFVILGAYLISRVFPKTARIISVLSIVAICGVVVYLVVFLVSNRNMGHLGNSVDSLDTSDTANPTQLEAEKMENCIVVSYDKIIIGNEIVDIEFVKNYINERRLSNTTIYIVDDYSLASTHHEVTDLCKDVNIIEIDYEKWNEE